MKKNKKYIVRINNLYVVIFTIWYFFETLLNTTIMNLECLPAHRICTIINYFTMCLMMVQIVFFQCYSYREICILLLVSIVVIISTVLSSNNHILSMWIFIIAAKNEDIDSIVKIEYHILRIIVPMIMALFFLKVIDEVTVYRSEHFIRHSLGFEHPNQLGFRIFQLIACRLYLHRDRYSIWDITIIVLGIIFSYLVPNSQTSVISLFFLLLISLIYGYLREKNAKIKEIVCIGCIIIAILMNVGSIILSTRLLREGIWYRVNNLLSQRFSWCYAVYKIYGMKLWGNNIAVTLSERTSKGLLNLGNMWLDNAYMSMVLRFGIIMYLFFSVLYIGTMIYSLNSKQYYLAMIMFVYAVYGVMETGLYQMSYNIVLPAIAYFIYKKSYSTKNSRIVRVGK